MTEVEAIVEEYHKLINQEINCILATVVHVEGSSYRRAGARMLVDQYGQMTGAISGGCLEGDALTKALLSLHQNKNKLVTYDTSNENDAVVGAQLGCEGVIQVLFEPINFEDEKNPLELIEKAIIKTSSTVGTFFHLNKNENQPGTLLAMDANDSIILSSEFQPYADSIWKDCQWVITNKSSVFREYRFEGKSQFAFLESFSPPPRLVIVGAGNDAQILSKQAELLGWNIVITDGRDSHANADRFTSSCQVIVTEPEEVLNQVSVDDQTYFVLMTHNYHYDLSVLEVLLTRPEIPYIGILGPKKKFNRMLDDLQSKKINITEHDLKRIYAPVGLEIGAESPTEIGLSIISEIQAVRTKTNGSFLKEKTGPIHLKKNNEFKQILIE